MLKKVLLMVMLSMLLSACGADPVETVSVTLPTQTEQPCQVVLDLPEEAAAPVAGEAGRQIYFCDGYEIQVQSVRGIGQALQQVTGLPREKLTVLQRKQGSLQRYETVWCSPGEVQEQVGRAVILEQGDWCYCVSMLSDAAKAEELQEVWQQLCDGIRLS